MLSGATWYFEIIIGLVHAVIGGGRDVACDNRWQHDQLPRGITGRCSEARNALGMH